MPSTFTDDLKHMVKDAASGARDRLTAIQGGVQPTLVKMRALPAATKKKIAVAGVAVAVLGLGLAVRGGKSPASERIADRPTLRGSDLGDLQMDAPRPPARAAQRSYAVGKAEEKHGEFKAAAESYLVAARKGDGRGLKKLVAMTHAPKCEARSEAADALGTMKSKKAIAALKKLARSRFKDESRSPGIFSCSSRRAAQKALERQTRG
jgi:hypothetical protein